jgi:CRISPR-associated endonuclease/helicase Cas3
MLHAEAFDDFFEQVHGAGLKPFPWQQKLVREALAGRWPKSIALPTAAGKTALIDIAVYALAAGAPESARRIFFIVDRRVVVDEAVERARRIADRLRQATSGVAAEVAQSLLRIAGVDAQDPLCVATLRGGQAPDDIWTESPLQPTVCCSTVDQTGSSLLFRAYGSRSNHNWPIRAALAAEDALLIIDEAHTAQPFLETLGLIERYRTWGDRSMRRPFRVIEMSATPRNRNGVFEASDADRAHPVLGARWSAAKPARLVIARFEGETGAAEGNFGPLIERMSEEARGMREAGARVIGVVSNRVATARAIYQKLKADAAAKTILMTGRSRPFDRERLWNDNREFIELGREGDPEQPIYVVATQCIEVGANIDFDALVTEAASIDALEQRFGRLNRNGRAVAAQAVIVAQQDQTAKKYVDPVYGGALAATWRWLVENASSSKKKGAKPKGPVVDMGVHALRRLAPDGAEREALSMPRARAPVLLPAHVDRLSETSPAPAVAPEVALFLHGPQAGPPDVQVVWRADLDAAHPEQWADKVSRIPPRPEEMISVPAWAVRRWLSETEGAEADIADVEGTSGSDLSSGGRLFLDWRGADETKEPIREIRPGMTIVVPASYGGCDEWGWNPECAEAVRDIADQVSLRRAQPTLRLDEAVVAQWDEGASALERAAELRLAETMPEVREKLAALAAAAKQEWVRNAATKLMSAGRLRQFRDNANEDGIAPLAALAARGSIDQEDDTASYTAVVELDEHLKRCANRVRDYAEALELPPVIATTVVEAARLHDIGKADPRFQSWLRGGEPFAPGDGIWAKSGANGNERRARERARWLAGYPRGGRHELQSAALLERASAPDGEEMDWELLLHLIASHHGRCRPFAPVVEDPAPVEVCYGDLRAMSNHRLAAAGSGVSERFWKLTRRYGWWGLAYLETLVRLADQRESEREQEQREDRHAAAAD